MGGLTFTTYQLLMCMYTAIFVLQELWSALSGVLGTAEEHEEVCCIIVALFILCQSLYCVIATI